MQEQKSEEIAADSTAAETKLERIFSKSSYWDLKTLGQFDLGFILAQMGTDLFTIDQRAFDKKVTSNV